MTSLGNAARSSVVSGASASVPTGAVGCWQPDVAMATVAKDAERVTRRLVHRLREVRKLTP